MTTTPVVCPLCPLHCDDLDPVELFQGETVCSLANARIATLRRSSAVAAKQAHVTERDDEGVLAQCRQWIQEAKRIVISGEVIDLETSRAISDFVTLTGAEVGDVGDDRAYGECFSREGAFMTTLGELTAREVSVLTIGEPAQHWPRLNETLSKVTRHVGWPGVAEATAMLAQLRRCLAGSPLPIDSSRMLLEAHEMITSSTYLVVIVAPVEQGLVQRGVDVNARVFWSSLTGLIRELNVKSRAALMRFDRSLTLRSVLVSRSDWAAHPFSTQEPDLRIHFDPFGDQRLGDASRAIVIGCGADASRADANPASSVQQSVQQHRLAASIPGLHHLGVVIRGDGSVTLPLQSPFAASDQARAALPSPAQRLRSLLTRTADPRSGR